MTSLLTYKTLVVLYAAVVLAFMALNLAVNAFRAAAGADKRSEGLIWSGIISLIFSAAMMVVAYWAAQP